jgi:hypothetical protein
MIIQYRPRIDANLIPMIIEFTLQEHRLVDKA